MDYLTLLAIKVASDPMPPLPDRRNALRQLLAAKAESDRRRYAAKHQILRDMIMAEPDKFEIDSENNGIVGLTRIDNNFRIHIPRTALPTVKLRRRPPKAITG